MNFMPAGATAILCVGLLLPAALVRGDCAARISDPSNDQRVLLCSSGVVSSGRFRQDILEGVREYGVQGSEGNFIQFGDDFAPDADEEFEFSLRALSYGDDMIREIPAGVNEDYMLSDLLIVSTRANANSAVDQEPYTVSLTRNRDPEAPLPIPEVAVEKFGTIGERRDYVDAPKGCPAGFEYRLIDVDADLSSATTCRCPKSCTTETSSCTFSGDGRYAISVVPDWLCAGTDATPAPRNDDDPINETAAIAAGTVVGVLALCCVLLLCMLCVNVGPKDDHWHHAPRKPGAIPLPPDYEVQEDVEEQPVEPLKEGPAPPKIILRDGNPIPYSIDSPNMPPPVGGPSRASPPPMMTDPRPPAPSLVSPPLPNPY